MTIDVLAVMQREARFLASYQPHASAEMTEARAAVAELIEAACAAAYACMSADGDHTNGFQLDKGTVERLRAALARCTGEGA